MPAGDGLPAGLPDRELWRAVLKRRGSETDRRVKHLFLSAAGKKAVEHIRSHAAELRREILSGSSKEEIGTALQVFQCIRDKLARNP